MKKRTGLSSIFVVNPFVSEDQRRACYAADDPNWDCKKWEKVPKKKRPTRNAGKNLLKVDPTRTGTLRRGLVAELKRRFARIKSALHSLLVRDDAFGLRENMFCPTGPGGGVDPTCSSGGSGSQAGVPIQELSPEEASELASTIRAGDARSKNRGERRSESITKPQVIVDLPLSSIPDEVIQHLRESTDRARVEEYAGQKIDTPVIMVPRRKAPGFGVSDGGHRVLAAITRGDKSIRAMIPADSVSRISTNAFCPTGEGGGIDPTCSPGGGSGKPDVIPKNARLIASGAEADIYKVPGEEFVYRHEIRSVDHLPSGERSSANERPNIEPVLQPVEKYPGIEKLPYAPSYLDVHESGLSDAKRRQMLDDDPDSDPDVDWVRDSPGWLEVERDVSRRLAKAGYGHIDLSPRNVGLVGEAWYVIDPGGLFKTNIASNIFCPTGPGGGVDPTCSYSPSRIIEAAKSILSEGDNIPQGKFSKREKWTKDAAKKYVEIAQVVLRLKPGKNRKLAEQAVEDLERGLRRGGMDVNEALKAARNQLPNQVYFHGTTEAVKERILKEGLIPGKGSGADEWAETNRPEVAKASSKRTPSVFLSTDRAEAERYARLSSKVTGKKAVLLRVTVPKNRLHILKDDEQHFGTKRVEGVIPPEWITVNTDGETLWLVVLTDEDLDEPVAAANVFCPTGPGGGVDPTCSPGGSQQAKLGKASGDAESGGGVLMYRGVGEGTDTSSGFEWYSETPILAGRYASHRGGKVVESVVISKTPFEVKNPHAVLNGNEFFAKAMEGVDVKAVDKTKVLAARKEFLRHFGESSREIMDYWSNPAAKEVTRTLLEALGHDSIKMQEAGETTVAVLRKPPQNNDAATSDNGSDTEPSVGVLGKTSGDEGGSGNPKVREWANKKFPDPKQAAAFVEWFGDSKVVDENGEPLVVYHGMKRDQVDMEIRDGQIVWKPKFDVFTETGKTEPGIYFTPDEKIASQYGVPVPFYLRASSLKQSEDPLTEKPKDTDAIYRMRGKGNSVSKAFEIAVFSSAQIKLATGNRGTFDPSSPNIANIFCPTGEGGGVDPSCGKDTGGGAAPEEVRTASIGPSNYKEKGLEAPSLSPKETETLHNYTQSSYKNLNKALRDGEELTDYQRETVETLDKIIENSPKLPGDVTVWRGVKTENYLDDGVQSTLAKYKVDDEITMPEFVSTSFNPEVAMNHSAGKRSSGVVFEIMTDKGMVVPPHHSKYNDESELLLGRDLTYKVVGVHRGIQYETLDGSILKVPTVMLKVVGKATAKKTQNARFSFQSSPRQLALFQEWLATQFSYLDDRLLWERYVREGWKKGAGRAYDDTRKNKLNTGEPKTRRDRRGRIIEEPSTEESDFYRGGKEEFLRSSFGAPETVEKTQLLASRSLTDLKNVTSDMATKMSRHLVDGLTQGQNPREIARQMVKDLDIGKNRAETIARTEIIRAHAEGQLDAFERLGVEKLGVQVEWRTAGDDRVCEECESMDGTIFSVEEAHGMIPAHPNCRCAFLPYLDDSSSLATNTPLVDTIKNIFCPTGEGGGVDPSCGKDAGEGKGDLPFGGKDELQDSKRQLDWARKYGSIEDKEAASSRYAAAKGSAGKASVEDSKGALDRLSKLPDSDDEEGWTNMFDLHPSGLKLLDKITDRFPNGLLAEVSAGSKEVNLAELHTLQIPGLNREIVKDKIEHPEKRTSPIVVKYKGKLAIGDGNHTLAAMKLLGHKTAKVKFIDLDKKNPTGEA